MALSVRVTSLQLLLCLFHVFLQSIVQGLHDQHLVPNELDLPLV